MSSCCYRSAVNVVLHRRERLPHTDVRQSTAVGLEFLTFIFQVSTTATFDFLKNKFAKSFFLPALQIYPICKLSETFPCLPLNVMET